MNKIPDVLVRLVPAEPGEKYRYWQLADGCPWCGEKHIHGAGRPGANPADGLGWRHSHCEANLVYTLTPDMAHAATRRAFQKGSLS